ncbi:unnamed protein product [Oncorhynchus mykiss]|uniref:Cytosolic carboxypeptidase N-terminal domain-containing protein n=1 Tax=Oncorhynchus mykiss TaxID=8022 RepID=A0A060WES1_ONCMY|nr:unnamed protein product [Oncorhynchus mykiss]
MEENVRDVDTGSEAGREEALVGNVNKLMVTPTGYTGVSRKSHLVFDACFESGNLGRVDCISEFEFDLFIRPDTCNPRFRVWFNFTVENVQETQYRTPSLCPVFIRNVCVCRNAWTKTQRGKCSLCFINQKTLKQITKRKK